MQTIDFFIYSTVLAHSNEYAEELQSKDRAH